jgi:hypothetical protein
MSEPYFSAGQQGGRAVEGIGRTKPLNRICGDTFAGHTCVKKSGSQASRGVFRRDES